MVNRIFSKRTLNSPVFRMAVLMIVVLVAGASLQDSFLTLRNVQSICKQLAEYGILAVAVFICMLSGGIDLSVVYIANLCAIVIATVPAGATLAQSWHLIVLALLVALALGALCGLFNGVLIGRMNVPAMLATMGTGTLFLGVSTVITGGKALSGIPTAFTSIARVKVLELPVNFVVFLLCALVMGLLISQTAFGLRVQMIGTNSRAARFSGLNCPHDLMRVYTISGMFAAVSGAISIMRMSSAKPDYGTSYIMFSILICVFGGTHPDGGKGSVLGVVLATLVLQMVSTLMNMFSGLSAFYRDVIWGAREPHAGRPPGGRALKEGARDGKCGAKAAHCGQHQPRPDFLWPARLTDEAQRLPGV